MLEGVISSKTKISILVKLFLNPAMKAYLRELSTEFNVSSNSVRTELNNLADKMPEKVAQLAKRHQAWLKELGGGKGKGARKRRK